MHLRQKVWVSTYNANIAYTSYDMDLLISMMEKSDKQGENYTREEAWEITSFCSLFSDYAYQLNREELLRLYQDKDLHIFIDWVNAQYPWRPDAAYVSTLTNQLKSTDLKK
ncbi:MAG: hypothetical protein EOP54_06130 [Sphingobacteriales bacterium]|nr:MAG: hypothetical protein EOP54_06130 [Sphingobacteriales bacterium]